jgi:hypothetical protein
MNNFYGRCPNVKEDNLLSNKARFNLQVVRENHLTAINVTFVGAPRDLDKL